ncbi:hypothetical protein KQX54_009186 [Cotesia glomerata]|uniref:Uncharacterized protein n=2 Tax=Cotesia glomerata TaxID=32391 RepID=A0AAV7J068_COTGL|nr:hypothetical protein KQX54_009186 [Cotesia glomerata]
MYQVHRNFLGLTSHDLITVMTQRKACNQSNKTNFVDDYDYYEDENCYVLDIHSNYICEERNKPRRMVVFHSDFQGYHGIFLDGLLSILGYAEETDESLKNCTGIGREEILTDDLKYPLAWSACNIQQYSNQFRKFNCSNSRRNEAIFDDKLKEEKYNRSLLFYEAFELMKSAGLKLLEYFIRNANLTVPHNKN